MLNESILFKLLPSNVYRISLLEFKRDNVHLPIDDFLFINFLGDSSSPTSFDGSSFLDSGDTAQLGLVVMLAPLVGASKGSSISMKLRLTVPNEKTLECVIAATLSSVNDEYFNEVVLPSDCVVTLKYRCLLLHGQTFGLENDMESLAPLNLPVPRNGHPCLLIGHRGMGSEDAGFSNGMHRWPENSLISFMRAAELGLDMVELDAHLTRDKKGVVHHDFRVKSLNHGLSSGGGALNQECCTTSSVVDQLFRDVSMSDLLDYSITNHVEKPVDRLIRIASHSCVDNNSHHYAALADILRIVPSELAINIEIKYPNLREDGLWCSGLCGNTSREYYISMVDFVDTLLKEIFHSVQHQSDRFLVFSCFNPEICLLLCLKQRRYPVLFLTRGPTPEREYDGIRFVDIRCRHLLAALRWATFIKCQGIVTRAYQLLQNPQLISECKRLGLYTMAYGEPVNTAEFYKFAREMGLSGLIIDDVETTFKHFDLLK